MKQRQKERSKRRIADVLHPGNPIPSSSVCSRTPRPTTATTTHTAGVLKPGRACQAAGGLQDVQNDMSETRAAYGVASLPQL